MGGSLATVLTGDVGDGCGGWRMGAGDLGVSAFRGMRRGRGGSNLGGPGGEFWDEWLWVAIEGNEADGGNGFEGSLCWGKEDTVGWLLGLGLWGSVDGEGPVCTRGVAFVGAAVWGSL